MNQMKENLEEHASQGEQAVKILVAGGSMMIFKEWEKGSISGILSMRGLVESWPSGFCCCLKLVSFTEGM